jgi:two-component system KDP operon response regulator KdpE
VCDDEPQIVRALRVILREAGYEVSMAATLAEGLDLAARDASVGYRFCE